MANMFGTLPDVVIPTPQSTWWALVPVPVAGPLIVHPTAGHPAPGMIGPQKPEDFNTPAHPVTADITLAQTPMGYSFAPAPAHPPVQAPYASWWHPPTYEDVMASAANRRQNLQPISSPTAQFAPHPFSPNQRPNPLSPTGF